VKGETRVGRRTHRETGIFRVLPSILWGDRPGRFAWCNADSTCFVA
jgi:hypothetical protein